MRLGTIVTATDLNPMYTSFIPPWVQAWKTLVPEADLCIVMIADAIPEEFLPYQEHIRLFKPLPGIHTAFQAQCIRLLVPREITRKEGVLITDMDILPMSRTYYVNSIRGVPDDHFVRYRPNCEGGTQVPMCYNVALPETWTSIFGDAPTAEILQKWWNPAYDGAPGGPGWYTDQQYFTRALMEWHGPQTCLGAQKFERIDRWWTAWLSSNRAALADHIRKEIYVDYHAFRPYEQYKEFTDFCVRSLRRAE